ncbi:MAG TPA: hypothetical protein VND87_02350 [Stellaceae bacterium]|nr:hypothetical protein [Stellaceae bacterium]
MTVTPVERTAEERGGVTRHAYPTAAMAGDYLRAAAGLVPAGALLVSVPVETFGGVVLTGFAALFGLFGVRTMLRHASSIELDPTELRLSGVQRRVITWSALDRMKLAYYSTRRDRRAGWMQLELRAGGATVRLDSRIEGFDAVVRRAAAAANARGLELNPATVSNLQALGIRVSENGAER